MVRDGLVLCTCMIVFSQFDYPISYIILKKKKKNVVSHILKFLRKFNNSYDHFFLIYNKIECVIIFVL